MIRTYLLYEFELVLHDSFPSRSKLIAQDSTKAKSVKWLQMALVYGVLF